MTQKIIVSFIDTKKSIYSALFACVYFNRMSHIEIRDKLLINDWLACAVPDEPIISGQKPASSTLVEQKRLTQLNA